MGIYGDWAQKYFEMGYNTCPVWADNKCLIEGRQKWGTVKQTQEDIDLLTVNYDNYGIGLICGSASGILFIDQDFDGEGKEEFSKIVEAIIPPSPVRRKGSKNFASAYKWTKSPDDFQYTIKRGADMFCEVIDNGRYMVLPPSKHPKGMNYVWLTPESLLDFTSDNLPEFDFSAWDKIRLLANSDMFAFDKSKPRSGLGGRQGLLLGFVMKICDRVTSLEELSILCLERDKILNKENPYFLDTTYFRGITAEQAAIKCCRKWINWIKLNRKKQGVDWELGQDLKHKTLLTNFYFKEEKPTKNGDLKAIFTPDYNGWAEYIIDTKKVFSSEGPSYIYDEEKRHYRTICDKELDSLLTKTTKGFVRPTHRNHFIRTLSSFNFKNMNEIQKQQGLINLNNGVLNIKTKELMAHSSDYFFTYCLPHDYDKNARSDRWMKFLDDVFKGNEELKLIAAQIFGYVLYGGNPWLHKAFVLYGEGRNGKSTFLDVLKRLIGNNNFSSISLAKLDHSFSIVHLDDKLANIVEETPNDKINAEIFKTAIGGGHLTGCKKYEDEYQFECSARLIFACNEMPKFSENSTGLLERLYFLPFKTYFEPKVRNGEILDQLFSELPGILNWALSGLDLLLENRRLPTVGAITDTFEQYKKESDSVYAWCLDNITENNKTEFISSKSIFRKYREDLKDTGRFPVSDTTFYKRFKKFLAEHYKNSNACLDKSGNVRGYSKIDCIYYNDDRTRATVPSYYA